MYPYRRWIFFGFLLVVIASAAGIALLGLAGWFISAAAFAGLSTVTAAQFNYLLPGAGVRLFAYIRIAARYGERVINHEAVFRLISSLRMWLFNHLTCLSPLQLTFIKNGELLNRFMSDIGVMDNLFLRIITPFFSTLFLVIVTVGFLFLLNTAIAIISFITILTLLILLSMIMLKWGRQASNAYQQALNSLRSLVTYSTQALREIFLFNAIQIQSDSLNSNLNEISQAQEKLSKKNGIAQAVLIAGIGSLVIITLLLSIHASIRGHLNGANIAVVFLIIFALGELLQPVITAFLLLGQTEQAATNINTIIATQPLFNAPLCASFDIKQEPFEIKISNVFFSYSNNEKPVLNSFSMEISAAQHLVLVGQSGVGKTTLINLLARFIKPQAGMITIDNRDIYSLTDQQWQSLFCIVPQNPYLFDMTLRENLLLANPVATDEMCWHALEVCQLKPFIESLPQGLDTYIGQNGARLSGGQARRVAIARAVLKNAPITILDEPTEGLDHATEIAIIQALRAYFRSKTLLVVSHRSIVIDSFPVSQMLHGAFC
jgi:ATP-binding cassette subfamily C protein CydC